MTKSLDTYIPVYARIRDILEDVKNAVGWGSFDACMNTTACKVVFIILVVVGGLIALWILSLIFRCCFYGMACTQACCQCCGCCGSLSNKTSEGYQYYPPQLYKNTRDVYNNPNMYPAQPPPMYPPQYAQQPINHQAQPTAYEPSYQGNHSGYQQVYPTDENPYHEKNAGYRGAF